MSETKKRLMLEHYSSEWSRDKYAKVELWEVERVLVSRFIPRDSKILEMGCGAGRATIPLKKMGHDITGIDIVPRMIEGARHNARESSLQIDFAVMDASETGFEDGSFDAVLFLYNGIESVPGDPKRQKVINEAYRILKDGGVFLLVTQSVFNRRGAGLCARKFVNSVARRLTLEKARPFDYLNGLEYGECVIWLDGMKSFVVKLTNPFTLRRWLRDAGFRVDYINSRNRVLDDRLPSPLSAFTDRTMYYVAVKGSNSEPDRKK